MGAQVIEEPIAVRTGNNLICHHCASECVWVEQALRHA